MAVVTIAGEFGSGEREIAKEVARLLGADYVDKEIIAAAAQQIGTTVDVLAKRDERPTPVGERISKLLEKSAASSTGDPFLGPGGAAILLSSVYPEAGAQEVDNAHYLQIIRSVVRDLAQAGNVVIVGRGGQLILRAIPTALHVYVVAPFDIRVGRVMQQQNIGQEAADKLTRDTDRNRAAYIRKFFGEELENPMLYDIVINTSKQSFGVAAQIIADAARALETVA